MDKRKVIISASVLIALMSIGVVKNTLVDGKEKEIESKVESTTDKEELGFEEEIDESLGDPYFPNTNITNNNATTNKNESGKPTNDKTESNGNNNNKEENKIETNKPLTDKYKIVTPKYGYEQEPVFIDVYNLNKLSIKEVLKDGKPIKVDQYIEGEVNKDSGSLKFKEKGNYTIKFTGKDLKGKTITHEGKLKIYPMVETKFNLPNVAMKNESIEVNTELKNTDRVEWTIFKGEKSIPLNEAFEGTLSNTGGKIKFKENGKYTLKTSYVNEIGRKFGYSATIDITDKDNLIVEEFTHTDKKANIKLITDEESNVEWEVFKDNEMKNILPFLNNNLSKNGGYIEFKEEGLYTVKAKITDSKGILIRESIQKIRVHPVLLVDFEMPKKVFKHNAASVSVIKNNKQLPIKWEITNDKNITNYSSNLNDKGGNITFKEEGTYEVKATIKDSTERTFSTVKKIEVVNESYQGNHNTPPTDPKVNIEKTRTVKDGKFLVNLTAESTDADKDEITYEWEGKAEDNYYEVGSHTVKVRAVDSKKATSKWVEVSFDTISNAPTNPKVEVEKTRTVKDGKFLVNLKITEESTDIDNDEITYEYEGKAEDNYYEVGSHTVKVRAVDSTGATSEWVEVSFDTISNAPTNPKIEVEKTRTVKDGKFLVNINMTEESTDADNDKITYEWENKADDNYYEVGSHTVRVRAIDSTGATSEWVEVNFEVISNAPTNPKVKVEKTRTVKEGKFLVNLTSESTDVDNDEITYEYEGKTVDNYYEVGSHTVKVRAIDSTGATSEWVEVSFEVISNAPTNPKIEVEKTRTVKDGKFLVNINMTEESTDADNDKITYEWENKADDNYYEVGSHTVRVRAIDNTGATSEWVEVNFEVISNAPTNPKVKVEKTRTVKDGKFLVNITSESTDADNDEITYKWENKADDNYYSVGSHTVRVRAVDSTGATSEWVEVDFEVISNAPTNPKVKVEKTRTVKDGKFLVNITSESTDADNDEITYEYEGKTEDNYYSVGSHTVRARAVDNTGATSEWVEVNFEVISNAPTNPTTSVEKTRTVKNGKFLVNLTVNSTDVDGDRITYEYEGKTEDNYYSVGSHTVRVRAIDSTGATSEWVAVNFEVINNAPTAPVINRNPNGNSIIPNTPVTITGNSTDADGDEITYVWENRPSETSVYPLGKNVVRVKAVDKAGAESPWSAIVFFVADPNNGGGMQLTGPDSVIMENGFEGATILNYTFNVPAVDGHSGNDYGRVRGFNVKTQQWDQIDYRTTSNGVSFSNALPKGIYSKLEFYYYTDHNCMYGKSNITYSVEYYFE